MIAVTSAMVVPSLSSVSQGSVGDEAKRLRLVMSFALEEAQLSGMPLRWLASQDGWRFESWVETKKGTSWQPFSEPPLEPYQLPDGVVISNVEQAGSFSFEALMKQNSDKKVDVRDEQAAVIGMALLLPDGTTSQSNVTLTDETQTETSVVLIRPGPAGIRLKKAEEL